MGRVSGVLFLTGPCGAGKSTTARAWADAQTVPTVCIDVDALRLLVRTGRARPELEWDSEASRQWESACRIAVAAAAIHRANGAQVVIEVYAPPAPPGTPGLPSWDELLIDLEAVVVHLMPSLDACLARNAERTGEARIDRLAVRRNYEDYAWCIDATKPANVIDTTNLSVSEVVESLGAVQAASPHPPPDVAIRHWRRDDAAALEAARDLSEAELATWTPGMHGDLVDVPALLDKLIAAYEHEEFLAFAIVTPSDLAGYCSLRHDTPTEAEVGYWVRTDMTGRGIATSAIGSLIAFAFDRWAALERVVLKCDGANTGSVRVAERNGFVRVSETKWEPRNESQSGVEILWERRRG